MGSTKSDQIFFYCKGNQLSNLHLTMGDIYDKYKDAEGWLEIKIHGDSTF